MGLGRVEKTWKIAGKGGSDTAVSPLSVNSHAAKFTPQESVKMAHVVKQKFEFFFCLSRNVISRATNFFVVIKLDTKNLPQKIPREAIYELTKYWTTEHLVTPFET